MSSLYRKIHSESLSTPDLFWLKAAGAVAWNSKPTVALEKNEVGMASWFPDGILNTCFNAVDRHVIAGKGQQNAILYESPVTKSSEVVTYADLLERTAKFAGALRKMGVTKGDRVLIYMPMIPEAAIAMLACARLGAVHSVVFGGFAAAELATRVDDCTPKVIVAASCGVEPKGTIEYMPIVRAALRTSKHQPGNVVVFQRAAQPADLQVEREMDWHDSVAQADAAECVAVCATDPLYILYTSGTTGQPKGVVRDNGGHAVALTWSMKHLFGINPGDVFWAASDIGWQVGHTYTVYGPLLAGCSTVLYEGKPVGTPDASAFWRLIDRHEVSVLLTAPTAIRSIRRDDPEAKLVGASNLSSLRALFLAGERSDPSTLQWSESVLGVPVVDHWWQTESGWPITGNPLGVEQVPVRHGSVALPMVGWHVSVLGSEGEPVEAGEQGSIVIKLPLPPGALTTLWNGEERFRKTYLQKYPGFYNTGDAGFIDKDGYIWIMARTDDVINVAGHRIATGALEEIVGSHPAVAECAVVGVADALKGQVPIGLLVLKRGADTIPDDVVSEVVQLVRDQLGAVASFRQAIVIDRLPKTRSGKILRSTIQRLADGANVPVPATIEDASVLPEIRQALAQLGFVIDETVR